MGVLTSSTKSGQTSRSSWAMNPYTSLPSPPNSFLYLNFLAWMRLRMARVSCGDSVRTSSLHRLSEKHASELHWMWRALRLSTSNLGKADVLSCSSPFSRLSTCEGCACWLIPIVGSIDSGGGSEDDSGGYRGSRWCGGWRVGDDCTGRELVVGSEAWVWGGWCWGSGIFKPWFRIHVKYTGLTWPRRLCCTTSTISSL